MNNCPNCDAEVIHGFEICWNCNYSFEQKCVLQYDDLQEGAREINCLRCSDVKLMFTGTHKFHEGSHLGMGGVLSVFMNKENFDIYVCPKCGKAEFFVPVL